MSPGRVDVGVGLGVGWGVGVGVSKLTGSVVDVGVTDGVAVVARGVGVPSKFPGVPVVGT
jgi:hypothetical protein